MSLVPREDLKTIWPVVAPLLAPAVSYSHGRLGMSSIFDAIQDQRNTLWVIYDSSLTVRAAFTTRVAHYPKRSLVVVETAGGRGMNDWLGLVQQTFRDYARDLGADGVEMYGRAGWARALRRYGWTQTMVLCEVKASETANA